MIRSILVIAAHGVEEKLRSWTFWLTVLALPLILVVVVAITAVTDPEIRETVTQEPLALVIEDPALAEELGEVEFHDVERLDEVPPGRTAMVLEPDGPGVSGRLIVPEQASVGRARDHGEDVLRVARAARVLDASDLERLGWAEQEPAPPITASGVAEMLVMLCAFATMMALVSGLSAATQLFQARDSEFFHVLRLSTSTTALYLGGLLERMVLGLVLWGPLLGLPAMMVVLLVIAVGIVEPDRLPWLLVGLPLCIAASVGGAYLTGASAGALASRVTGPRTKGPRLGSTLLLVAAMPLAIWLASWDASRPGLWVLFPVAGLPLGLKGVESGLPALWLIPVLGVQAGWTAAVVALGSWAYAVEDEPLEDLRRRWGRA